MTNRDGRAVDTAVGPAPIGTTIEMTRTIAESDVYMFAGITGDGGRNHQDESYMRTTRYGRRLVQGAYLVGLMSGASVGFAQRLGTAGVSYGYDRIRFTGPVFIGDTVRIRYEVVSWEPEKALLRSQVTCTNEQGTVVAVATHILKLFPGEGSA